MKRSSVYAATAALGLALAGGVSAKLPAPTEEQQAKAAEAKAKADEGAKKAAEALAKSQDRAVDNFKRTRATRR
ncbi:MAG TPA: hypothetical protein VHP37_23425 [Burkholderiales bacterium]|nr:hypothetical protein [Burkholderiales bacterium]